MDRNQRSRNQKKSVPPRKGQPSHRNTKKRPAAAQQPPGGQPAAAKGQRPAPRKTARTSAAQTAAKAPPPPTEPPKAGVPFQRATGAAPRYPRGTAANPPPQGHHRGAVRFGSAGGRHCAFHQPVVQGDGFPGWKMRTAPPPPIPAFIPNNS